MKKATQTKNKVRAKLSSLIVDTEYQVRKKVNGQVVNKYAEAMRVGNNFPPMVIEEGTNKIVCGFTRFEAYTKAFDPNYEASVEFRSFKDESERILFATKENTHHGQPLETWDIKNIAVRLRSLGISDETIAFEVGMSTVKLVKLAGQTVTVPMRILSGKKKAFKEVRFDSKKGNLKLVEKPVKRGLAHLHGTQVTAEVHHNIEDHYSGQPVTYHVNQVIMRIDDGTVDKGNGKTMDRIKVLYEKLGKFLNG